MATSGIASGTLGAIYIGGTKIMHLTTNSFSTSIGTRSTLSKDSAGWDTHLTTVKSWKVSAEGLFTEDTGNGYEDLYDALVAGASVTLRLSSAVTGDKYYEGSVLVTSLEKSDPDNENSTWSVEFLGTGAITKAAVS